MPWVTRHPRTLIALLGALLLCVGGGAVGYLNVRNLQRIELIQNRLSDMERIRELRHRLERSLLDEVREGIPAGSFLAQDVLLQVENALALESYLDPETALGLRQIAEILSHSGVVTRNTLIRTLEVAGNVQEAEARAQRNLLEDIQSDGRNEFYAGIGVLAALAALISITAWLLPKRLLDPLSDLRERFRGFAEGQLQPLPVEELEPSLLPLFRNYNTMVARMTELEEERRARAQTLEDEVRAATRTLVAHQRTLADAQRLAAVGETAAGVAHELRNPLAGILASLENLRRETHDPATLRRVELLHAEAERVVRLLNDYLAAARHRPEPLRPTDIRELTEELLALLRYQVPGTLTLAGDVETGLVCSLPRDRVRQMLMNLVWNSVEAMGTRQGTIAVRGRREGESVVLEIWDDGPGFPAEFLGNRVQAFRTRRAGGTGLGLAMVQRTLQEMGGSLTLANRDPAGAAVRLSIPCRSQEGE